MIRMIECESAKALIQSFLDGELAERERRALDEHAARCGTCASALADAKSLAALLSDWPRVAPSADFVGQVAGALRARRRQIPALPARVLIVAGGLAAAITAVLVAAPTRWFLAQVVVEGTDRGASGALILARAVTLLVACVTPLLQKAAESLAPLVTIARATLVAIQHVRLAPAVFLAAAAVLLLLVAVFRLLVSPRERRGFHALVL